MITKRQPGQSATLSAQPSKTSGYGSAVPQKDIVEEFDFEQRSDEWYAARLALVTASVLSDVMASGADGGESKVRKKLMNRLAAEAIFRRPMETFSNAAMDRGVEMEPALAERYAFVRGVELRPIGFVRRTICNPLHGDLVVGCSPDRLVGDDGLLQIKTMQPDLLIALLDSGRFPSEHKWQCHGEIWVTGRQWADLYIGYDGFPLSATFRIPRSEEIIGQMRVEVEKFDYELRQLIKRMEARKS